MHNDVGRAPSTACKAFRHVSEHYSVVVRKRTAKLFPIADMYSGDSTIEATADAFEVLTRMGVNIPMGAMPPDWCGMPV